MVSRQHGGSSAGSGGRRGAHDPSSSSAPPPDSSTFRDLLIFEERLKQNASRLQKRKRKYETLLVISATAVLYLSYHVVLARPQLLILHRLNIALLLFLCTSIFLFFASGMYGDRITAANKFVPQANRSLRNFNMYLNTRTSPRRGILARLFLPFIKAPKRRWSNPPSRASSNPGSPVNEAAQPDYASLNPSGSATFSSDAVFPPRRPPSRGSSSRGRLSGASSPIGAGGSSGIPLAANPRGELIFNSKVSPTFRDGYERYRSAFERRRSEKLEAKREKGWRWFLYTGAGWGWWVKEIWKPPEPEPLRHHHHHHHLHHHQQHAGAAGHTGGASAAPANGSAAGQQQAPVLRAPRHRSGTMASIGSSNSAGSASSDELLGGSADEEGQRRPGTPSSSTRSRKGKRRVAGDSPAGSDLSRQSSLGSASGSTSTFGQPVGTRSKRATIRTREGRDRERDRERGEQERAEADEEQDTRSARGRDATPSPVTMSGGGGGGGSSSGPARPSPPPSPHSEGDASRAEHSKEEVDRQLLVPVQDALPTDLADARAQAAGQTAATDPDAKAVAATGDDRSDALSTLREPEPAA